MSRFVPKTLITTYGRVCTFCNIFKLWDDYYSNQAFVASGRHSICKECLHIKKIVQIEKLRREVFDQYGSICQCCGESNFLFLQLDHVNNDGAKERKELGLVGGHSFYRYLKKQNYPEGYQVLCANCNFGKRMNKGVCPHERSTNG
jgi:hypothetical protein